MHVVQPLFNFNWNLLFSVITFLGLFLVLYHFFFKKVHDFMEARAQRVKDTLESAMKTSQEADDKLRDYEERIANVERESRTIIKQARDEAKLQASTIIDDANEKAKAAIAHSQEEIQREKYDAQRQLREEVGNLAVLAAGKIIEKEITPEEHSDIINKVIEEAEDNPWK